MVGSLIVWWYGRGWRWQLRNVSDRLQRWIDYFSFGIITRTLFAPFRQIGAGKVSGPLDVQFRAWLDRTFSRVVGFFVRFIVLIAGAVAMVVIVVLSVLQLLGWLLVPLAPIAGFMLMFLGWTPHG